MKINEKTWLIILAVVCAVYILLRFWNLTASCLWFDELFSVHAARQDWASIFGFVAQDLIHPPLFYVLLKIWITFGGESLFWVRLFPVLFSIVALFPLFRLGRELKLNDQTIALAVSFLAFNGALLKYAQEVRMYSLFFCLALFSMWLFARFLILGKNIWILTLVNLLLVYTHYFGWLAVFSEIAAIIILQRIKARQMLIMLGILLAGFAPWFFAVLKAGQANEGLAQNIGWIVRPDWLTFFQFIFDLLEPFYYQQSNIEPTSLFGITVPVLLIGLTAFVFYFIFWESRQELEKQNFYLLAIFVAVPVLTALLASWILPYSVWGTRHLILVFAPASLLSAMVLEKINLRPLKILLLGGLFFFFAVAFITQFQRGTPPYIWCAWENLAQTVDRAEPSKIYVFEDLVAYNLWFALRDAEKNFQIVKVKNIEGLMEDSSYFLPRGFDAVQTTNEEGMTGERFYIAFRDSVWNEKHPPLRNLIKKGYKFGEPRVFEADGLKAFLVPVEK